MNMVQKAPVLGTVALTVLVTVVACSREEVRTAESDAAAAVKRAREALATEVREDIASSKKVVEAARASLSTLDEKVASAYRAALDEADEAQNAAGAALSKATGAADDAFEALGKDARAATAGVKRTAQRIAALTGEVKDDFVREADSVMSEIRDDMDALERKAARLDEAGRKEAEKTAAELKKGLEETGRSLDKAKTAAADSWKDTRHEVNRSMLELRSRVRKAREALERG